FRFGGKEGFEYAVKKLRRDARPGVARRDHDILPRRDLRVPSCVLVVERGISCLYGEPPAALHRVARVDGEVQDRILKLRHVHAGVPETAGDDGLKLNFFSDRAAQHLIEPPEITPKIDHLRLQRLSPPKCKKLGCKLRSTRDTRQGVLDAPFSAIVSSNVFCEELKVAADDLQQIVEVVSDATRELADRLHFLGLTKLCGDRLALLRFLKKLLMSGVKLGRSPLDALFERLIHAAERQLSPFSFTDVDAGARHIVRAAKRIPESHALVQEPAFAAVLEDDAVFHLEICTLHVGVV